MNDSKDSELIQILALLEAQSESIEALGALPAQLGDIRRTVGLIVSNEEMFHKEVMRLVEDHEKRIMALESRGDRVPHAPRSPSFTNEINQTVSNSIRAATEMQAPILETMAKNQTSLQSLAGRSVLSQIVTGLVLALAIVAFVVYGHH
jgi:hypothetical protein